MISCNKKLKSAAETTPIRNNEVFLLWSGWLPNKFVLLH